MYCNQSQACSLDARFVDRFWQEQDVNDPIGAYKR